MLVHVHVLVNAQQHCSCVYRRSHMCQLECNACGGITAVVLSRCSSLYLTLRGSLWTSMASQPSSRLPHTLWFLSVCAGYLSAMCTTSRHRLYCAEGISYFSAACSKCRSIPKSARNNTAFYVETAVQSFLDARFNGEGAKVEPYIFGKPLSKSSQNTLFCAGNLPQVGLIPVR